MTAQPILAIALFVLAGALVFCGLVLLLRGKHSIHDIETEVSKYSRLVVAKRAGITSTLALALAFAVGQHWIPQPWSGDVQNAANAAIDALAGLITLAGILWAHKGATPADPALNPTDKYGNPLVSALSVGPHPGTEAPAMDPEATTAIAAAEAIYPSGQPTDTPAA